MIVLCAFCGARVGTARGGVAIGAACPCRGQERPPSQLEAVVQTAAAMGGVTEDTLRAAAAALREEPS